MKNLPDIDKLTKDTRRFEFLDGLVDITYGVVFLALGLLCWFFFSSVGLRWYITSLIKNREITILGMVLLFSLFLLLVFGSQRIVQRFRQSTFWKRSGFVKTLHRQVRWPIQLTASLVSITIIISSFGLMLKGHLTQDVVLRSLVFSVGIATGITFLGLGIDLKLKRYIYVGACGIVFSTIILFSPLSFSMAWLFFGTVWMGILLLSGVLTLRQYLITSKGSHDD